MFFNYSIACPAQTLLAQELSGRCISYRRQHLSLASLEELLNTFLLTITNYSYNHAGIEQNLQTHFISVKVGHSLVINIFVSKGFYKAIRGNRISPLTDALCIMITALERS